MAAGHLTSGELHDYFCEALTPSRDSAVAAHLARCAACAQKALKIKALLALLEPPKRLAAARRGGLNPKRAGRNSKAYGALAKSRQVGGKPRKPTPNPPRHSRAALDWTRTESRPEWAACGENDERGG